MVICGRLWKTWISPYLDEIVAVEGIEHVGDVVPHLGVEFAGAVAEHQRKVELAALLLPDLLGVDQETGRDHLVRLELVHVGRFHCLAGAAASGLPAVRPERRRRRGGRRRASALCLLVPGIGIKRSFLWRLARGHFFLGGGLRLQLATSFQRVSLPGAAPLST